MSADPPRAPGAIADTPERRDALEAALAAMRQVPPEQWSYADAALMMVYGSSEEQEIACEISETEGWFDGSVTIMQDGGGGEKLADGRDKLLNQLSKRRIYLRASNASDEEIQKQEELIAARKQANRANRVLKC